MNKKSILSKVISLLLALIIIFPQNIPAHAEEGAICKIIIQDDDTYTCSSGSELQKYLNKCEYKAALIYMLKDWEGFYLEIPSYSNVTVYMQGHYFDRGLFGKETEKHGYHFYVNSKAKLIIDGGNSTNTNRVSIYEKKNKGMQLVKGAALYGGSRSGYGGGSIYADSESYVTLKNVYITGCMTDDDGGAIYSNDENNIIMVNSTITGCYSEDYGGAIYTDGDKTNIYMTNSHIDSNYSANMGGGIYCDEEKTAICGDGLSTVSRNSSNYHGAGIYLCDEESSVSGINLIGNKTLEPGSSGGAIYANDKKISLSNLVIKDNTARNWAGGIFVGGSDTTISTVTITGNSGFSAGIHIENGITNTELSGKCIINNNNSMGVDFGINNKTRLNLNLTRGSEVKIFFYNWEDFGDYRMLTEGEVGDTIKNINCIRYLICVNDGYHFTYNAAPNQRKIYVVKDGVEDDPATIGSSYIPEKAKEISVDAAKPVVQEKVITGESNEKYSLIRGIYKRGSMDDSTENVDSVYYYSDGFFDSDRYVYNTKLANVSYALTLSTSFLRSVDYKYRHTAGRQFLADIGCDEQTIYINEYEKKKPETDSIGVTIAQKKLMNKDNEETGKILIPIGIRSVGYDSEWANNVLMGKGDLYDGEHKGFTESARIVYDEVKDYIERYDLIDEVKDDKVIFWLAGFSRGGAVANIASKLILEDEDYNEPVVFGYTFEAPQGGTDKAEHFYDKSKYYCIHNTINKMDLVPQVAPSEMGFKRYGVDHYVPGTKTGAVIKEFKNVSERAGSYSHVTSRTTYRDNNYIESKTAAYDSLKVKMDIQTHGVDADYFYDDYFHLCELGFVPTVKITEVGKYDATVEDFIERFFTCAQYSSLQSRDKFAADAYNTNMSDSTIEDASRGLMKIVMGMDEESSRNFISRASSMMNYIGMNDMINFYVTCIGYWHNGVASEEQKKYFIDEVFLPALEKTDAFDYISEADKNAFETQYFPALMDFIMTLVSWDYATKTTYQDYDAKTESVLMGTFGANASGILASHNPEVNIPWLRTYDDNFDNETDAYKVIQPQNTDSPIAWIDGDPDNELKSDGSVNLVRDDSKLRLDVKGIKGESIYYTCTDITEDEDASPSGSEEIYYDGIELKTGHKYKVEAYAMYYGTKSDSVTYIFDVKSVKHKVTVITKKYKNDELVDDVKEYQYKQGETVNVSCKELPDKFLNYWTVADNNGKDVTDKVFDPSEKVETNAAFTMPMQGEDGFDEDYSLTINAVYNEKVKKVFVDLPQPEAGNDLPSKATISFEDDVMAKPIEINNISWSYFDTGYDIITSGEAYNNTGYMASFILRPIDAAADDFIKFADSVKAEMIEGSEGVNDIKCELNKEQGYVDISVTFDPTSTGGTDRPDKESLHMIEVKAFDLNADALVPDFGYTYYGKAGEEVTFKAPEYEDEVFYQWDEEHSENIDLTDKDVRAKSISVTIPDSDATLVAAYAPIIKKIDVTIDKPVATEPLAKTADIKFKVTNEFTVAPENVSVEWSTINEIADYDTIYTVQVGIVPDEDGSITVYDGEGTPHKANDSIVLSNDMEVKLNGEDAAVSARKVIYTFEATELKKRALRSITYPEDITGVPYGTDEAGINELLPKAANVKVLDRSINTLDINWNNLVKVDPSEEGGETLYKADGEIVLPRDVENDKNLDLNVSISVTVDGKERAASPKASVGSGSYLDDQFVDLSSDSEDASIYYSLDGSEPTTDSILYEGPISIKRSMLADESSVVTLKAIAVSENLRKSLVSVYNYDFINTVDVPTGKNRVYDGSSQRGVLGSQYYTLSADKDSGITIDSSGNAVATDAGTYKVTAKLADGFKWASSSEEESEDDPTADKIIEFTIEPVSLENAVVSIENQVYTGKELTPAVTLKLDDTELVQDKDFKVTYENNINAGTANVTIEGIGNYTGIVKSTFEITGGSSDDTEESTIIVDGKTIDLNKAESADALKNKLLKRKSDADMPGSTIGALQLKVAKSTSKSNKLTWKKVSGADGYMVFGTKCGKKNSYELLATKSGSTFTHKKLKKGTYYKYLVVAYKKYKGEDKVIAVNKTVHGATKGGKVTNYKTVKLKKKKVSLKKGKTFTIKSKLTKESKKLKVKKHVAMRYESSDATIAKVSKKGKVKALKKGKCKIYVYTQNGKMATLNVTVK